MKRKEKYDPKEKYSSDIDPKILKKASSFLRKIKKDKKNVDHNK